MGERNFCNVLYFEANASTWVSIQNTNQNCKKSQLKLKYRKKVIKVTKSTTQVKFIVQLQVVVARNHS